MSTRRTFAERETEVILDLYGIDNGIPDYWNRVQTAVVCRLCELVGLELNPETWTEIRKCWDGYSCEATVKRLLAEQGGPKP